ncbi:hypothetical protein B9Z55_002988 [Caenorhabditis nigoni]|uniref:Uncharacterized protein n=1 Tax=Caenorhabditis nigoni TaxID=1611254 RepID=A0A2G5VN02_9PELO|nr:hypothetical protein B9Z55_002988 [Caenorhabditis nigoni]
MGDLFENCAASTSDTNPKQSSSCSTSSEIRNNEDEPEDLFDYNNDNGGFVDKNMADVRVSNCQEDSDIQLEDCSVDNNSNKPFDFCIDSTFQIIPQEGETEIPTCALTKKTKCV